MQKFKAHISIDPAICSGKPCIKGTRIPVNLLQITEYSTELFKDLLLQCQLLSTFCSHSQHKLINYNEHDIT